MLTNDVFGISPDVRKHSYVDRGQLDEAFERHLSRSTHVAIRGPSKSGKSWLRQNVLNNPIVVQCRLKKPFSDIYVDALSQLDISLIVKEATHGSFKGNLSANGDLGSSLLAKVGIKAGIGTERGRSRERQVVGHDISDLRYVAGIIRESDRRLVIEDFHYMSTDDRKFFAFDLKALWDYGVFVTIIGIWCESNLLLHLNPDLTGRVTEISLDWSIIDLSKVIDKGSKALNLNFNQALITKIVQLSYSNAGLLQQLVLLTLDEHSIVKKGAFNQSVDSFDSLETACMMYADQLNAVYQQFARRVAAGIRTRRQSTGIYAHAMAVIMEASDDELVKGLHARDIFNRAVVRQNRIQYANLKSILNKLQTLQVDEDGRGLIIGYSTASEEVTIVDRQLLLYRKYATVHWPWKDLISDADKQGGQVDADDDPENS